MNYQESETVQRFLEGSVLSMSVKPGDPVGVDYETYYSRKDKYSLSCMHPYAYLHDSRFDAYMVSIVTGDGQEYVGPPDLFDWESLKGALFVAHNAAFDGLVYQRLCELGKCFNTENQWVCTADMMSFFGLPRSLKKAMMCVFGEEMSKTVRSDMDGRSFEQAIQDGMLDDLLNYAAGDARNCLRLWLEKGSEWPQVERDISRRNREAVWHGVHVDRPGVEEGYRKLKLVQTDAAAALPWTHPENDKDYKKPGSRPAFLQHCRACGLTPPKSIKKDNPEMVKFIADYKDTHPFIQARLDLASVGSHVSRLRSMLSMMDEEDVIRFPLIYFGAHTGRSTGTLNAGEKSTEKVTAKFNVLNIPKYPVFGVDLRGLLTPRPGHMFMIYDYGQIEPRITHWLAGNTAFLDLARKEDIYQANAKVMGWYPMDGTDLKHDNFELRQLSKACVIALGYGMGAAKFRGEVKKNKASLNPVPSSEWDFNQWDLAAMTRIGLDPDQDSDEEAVSEFMASVLVVRAWRKKNHKIPEMWKSLQKALYVSALAKTDVHSFGLPSGRMKHYFQPHISAKAVLTVDPVTGEKKTEIEKSIMASHVYGRKADYLFGGKIMENIIQSIARDVMFHGAMDVCDEAPSWRFLWNAYDEAIFEVPTQDVADAEEVIPRCMCRGRVSKWAPGLPLVVEGGPADRYLGK